MQKSNESLKAVLQYVLPWLVLIILLVYTYAKFFQDQYGFRWDPDTGIIEYVYKDQSGLTLQPGDQLVQIGSLPWNDFHKDITKTFFDGAESGQAVPITILRGTQRLTIEWTPGFTWGGFWDQFVSEWFIAYGFWLAGMITLFLVRPKDQRWVLLSLFYFFTAIWIIAGSGNSAYHIWYSVFALHIGVWLCVPIYLHLHWVFPHPLSKLPKPILWVIYLGTSILVVAEIFRVLPRNLFQFGFLIAILGSLILLLAHWFYQPDVRRDLRFLLIAIMLCLAPTLSISVISLLGNLPSWLGGGPLITLLLIPASYLYIAFRRQLGIQEMRINRAISAIFYFILLGIVFVPVIAIFSGSDKTAITVSFVFASIAAILTITTFPLYNTFIEHRIFGIPLPHQKLQEIYSNRITTAASLPKLLQLLDNEVFPTLLIRQFVFLQFFNGSTKILLSKHVPEDFIPNEEKLQDLVGQAGKYLPAPSSDADSSSWIRLVLSLKVENNLLGVWLLGKRDPDDTYSQGEIPILQSLANQTAVALSNIMHAETLRTLYASNIDLNEVERKRTARELHDSVLNQMAAIRMSIDTSLLPPSFNEGYQQLIDRLREIVYDLRPHALDFGLKAALDDLADNVTKRHSNSVHVAIDLQGGEDRYPIEIEQHFFRIVQEACENAIRHGKAKIIKITGQLLPTRVELHIKDDGIGFDVDKELDPAKLLSKKHYGLAGMMERAELISAKLVIHSAPNEDTEIQINWEQEPK